LHVKVAVGGFLADEILDLGAQARVGQACRRHVAQRVDEQLLAAGETHRQRVEQLGAVSIAAIPVAAEALRQVDIDLAHSQRGHMDSSAGAQSDTQHTRNRRAVQLPNSTVDTQKPLLHRLDGAVSMIFL